MKLKAISLWQPYASAIALGLKRYETRGYPTRWKGAIAIHAAQKRSREMRALFCSMVEAYPVLRSGFGVKRGDFAGDVYDALPFGEVLAVAQMDGSLPTQTARETVTPMERALGDYAGNRFAWPLSQVKLLRKPFPFSGKQGFFFVNIPNRLMPVRMCRVCGCTQLNACLTRLGPCHWVGPDLCSACE